MDWLDGAAIILACLLIGNITAYNERAKEKQFRKLQEKQDDCAVTVMRNGIEVRLHAVDIMVGDVVLLDLGDKVPADGIYIKGSDMHVDESSLTGEPDPVEKCPDSPFLFSGCTVSVFFVWEIARTFHFCMYVCVCICIYVHTRTHARRS